MKTIANTTAIRKTSNTTRTKPLSEAHIQKTCTDYLALDGWRCVRTDMPHLRGLGVSEPGMADNLYIRYSHDCDGKRCSCDQYGSTGRAEVLWVEYKKRGGKAEQHQKDWHALERSRGGLVWVLGENFEASIESFCQYYAASGLQRKKVSIPRG